MLDAAADAARFPSDGYLKAGSALAIACIPVVHHGELVGILYLENSLNRHAFTATRQEVLRLL